MKHPAHQYALDVSAGVFPACEMVTLACSRYLQDLENEDYEFRQSTAEAYIGFFSTCLTHTVGSYSGKPFLPLPWQQFILWNLYGFYLLDGSRRFNTAYISMSRKQGKTTLMAGMALAALVFDREPAAEVYSAATKRDQARILFDEARRMVMASPALRKHLTPSRHDITAPALNGKLTYLSSDGRTLDGTNPHTVIIDEYHAHPTDEVSNVLRSGMQARRNPMHLTITTAGLNKAVPCYALQATAKDILKGIKQDANYFVIIYELDEGDSWTDSKTWVKANPSLGHTISVEALKKQYQQALNMGSSYETEFKTKHLNQWTTAAATWIQDEQWTKGAGTVEMGGRCFGGLDLASVSDLTALVLLFPVEDEVEVKGFYWIPEATYNAAIESNPGHIYREFSQLPNFFITTGNVTDYSAIRRLITGVHLTPTGLEVEPGSLMEENEIIAIAYDRYNSTQIAIDLTDDGAPLAPYGQGFVSMSPGCKQLEAYVRSGRLTHDGDPVLRWALSNVELKTDPAGNIKPDKGKSKSGKIDPIAALVMAIGEKLRHGEEITDDMLKVYSL